MVPPSTMFGSLTGRGYGSTSGPEKSRKSAQPSAELSPDSEGATAFAPDSLFETVDSTPTVAACHLARVLAVIVRAPVATRSIRD